MDHGKAPVKDRPTPERLLQVIDGFREKRALVGALKKDADANLRKAVEVALGPLGPDTKTVVPEFVKALQSDSVDVRLGAVAALWLIAPEAPKAVPGLGIALKDRDTRESGGRLPRPSGSLGRSRKPLCPPSSRRCGQGRRRSDRGRRGTLGPGARRQGGGEGTRRIAEGRRC